MLRTTTTMAALLMTASASAQRAAGEPQPGAPQRPAQTTEIQGADQNQTRERNAAPRGVNRQPATENTRSQPAQAGRTTQRSAASGIDSHIADCLILGNQEEIALLKFGMERTKSSEVKEAAQKMIADHEKAVTQYRKFASPETAEQGLTDDQSRNGATRREALKVTQNGQTNSTDSSDQMHRLARRTAEYCLIMNREELTKYEGHEFDQAFLGQQLGAHITMLAKLKASGEEASSELASLINESQEVTKKHKDHLEKLMNQVSEKAHSKAK